ncbi:MAG: M13 family peptidase [Gammaproteobacteria bacterium]|nr:M13 family peptidase [Gammaproteobacteria bacterium]
MSDIRIQDDLYNYVNKEWLDKAIIPDDKPTTGGFADLAKEVEETLTKDFNDMCERDEYPNELIKNACTLYKAIKDVKRRKREGIKPALKGLAKIYKLKNLSALNRNLKDFIYNSRPLPFVLDVGTDMKNTQRHCVEIGGPSTILPDAQYYKEGMEAQRQALTAIWSNMAKQILAYTKLTAEEQVLFLNDTLAFDESIAKLVKTSEEWSEYTKAYNPMKTKKVCSMLKPIKFKKLLEELFGEVPEEIIVVEPRYLKGFSEVFNEEKFDQYKHWAYVTELINSTSLLSEDLRALGSSYRAQLSGLRSIPSVEKFAFNYASMVFSQPVGLFYGEKYFGEEAKKDVIEMVEEIVDRYKTRIKNNEFLSDSTKEKAILKLSKMGLKMGYPDKVDDIYSKYVFDENASAYEIATTISTIRTIDSLSKLNEVVDRTKWGMPGHMVNASYNPFLNDITFPAAILQPPFYSIKQTRSENLGGIGAVIGHEISHAFDNNGAQCDEDGNLNNWWTKEDFKNFKAKTKAMIKEFDGIELPWGKVNGSFIVSENIADNGGMAVTLDIMSTTPNVSYKEYFMNWARVWCMKAREEYLKLLIQVDVHAPAILRANMQPRNFSEWYDTFNVTKKDKMYIEPKKRVVIW